jgi:hypothetical protein
VQFGTAGSAPALFSARPRSIGASRATIVLDLTEDC